LHPNDAATRVVPAEAEAAEAIAQADRGGRSFFLGGSPRDVTDRTGVPVVRDDV
jgi:hypothetical protein